MEVWPRLVLYLGAYLRACNNPGDFIREVIRGLRALVYQRRANGFTPDTGIRNSAEGLPTDAWVRIESA